MAKRRRKLRSLIASKEAESKGSSNTLKLSIFISSILLAGLAIAAYSSQISTAMIWSDFLTTYRNHYNVIVHGEEDYCLPALDRETLFAKIQPKVLNQDAALSKIEFQLRNASKFVAIGIAGATGIGKSLFIDELRANFPWQENVQLHAWSSYNTEDHKTQVLTFVEHLSECGRNLIIIDNLEAKHVDFVQKYNKWLHETILEREALHVVVVYVFNLVTYTTEQRANYDDKLQVLEQLENVKVVEFRRFDSNDVSACIRNEVKNLNLTLDDGDLDEISRLIDAERSGCKNVYSKVMMYGKKKNS